MALTSDPWKDLNYSLSKLDGFDEMEKDLDQLRAENLVDLVRMTVDKKTRKDIRSIRDNALEAYNTFVTDFLQEPMTPLEAVTSNIALIGGSDDETISELWDTGVRTIGMLAAVNPDPHKAKVRKWISKAVVITRGAEVPDWARELFNKEFSPFSMQDVVQASPRYLLGIGPNYARKLRKWGVENVGQLSTQDAVEIRQALGISPSLAMSFVDKASRALGVDRAPDLLEEALANLREIAQRIRHLMEEHKLQEDYGAEVKHLANSTASLLDEYALFVDTIQKLRSYQ